MSGLGIVPTRDMTPIIPHPRGEPVADAEAPPVFETDGSWPFTGTVKVNDLPFRRWRETVVHHADLGMGFTWRDWPADYVRLELARTTMLWASRKPMGLTTLPLAAQTLPDGARLAWLLGRTAVAGLDPAGIF